MYGTTIINWSNGITAIIEDVTNSPPSTSITAPRMLLVAVDSLNPCVTNKESCTAGYISSNTGPISNFAWLERFTLASAVDCDFGSSGYYWAVDTDGNVEVYSGGSWKRPSYSTRYTGKAVRISVDRR